MFPLLCTAPIVAVSYRSGIFLIIFKLVPLSYYRLLPQPSFLSTKRTSMQCKLYPDSK